MRVFAILAFAVFLVAEISSKKTRKTKVESLKKKK
jgi:hypothetical protein